MRTTCLCVKLQIQRVLYRWLGLREGGVGIIELEYVFNKTQKFGAFVRNFE